MKKPMFIHDDNGYALVIGPLEFGVAWLDDSEENYEIWGSHDYWAPSKDAMGCHDWTLDILRLRFTACWYLPKIAP